MSWETPAAPSDDNASPRCPTHPAQEASRGGGGGARGKRSRVNPEQKTMLVVMQRGTFQNRVGQQAKEGGATSPRGGGGQRIEENSPAVEEREGGERGKVELCASGSVVVEGRSRKKEREEKEAPSAITCARWLRGHNTTLVDP